jgi:hypothetical protein
LRWRRKNVGERRSQLGQLATLYRLWEWSDFVERNLHRVNSHVILHAPGATRQAGAAPEADKATRVQLCTTSSSSKKDRIFQAVSFFSILRSAPESWSVQQLAHWFADFPIHRVAWDVKVSSYESAVTGPLVTMPFFVVSTAQRCACRAFVRSPITASPAIGINGVCTWNRLCSPTAPVFSLILSLL